MRTMPRFAIFTASASLFLIGCNKAPEPGPNETGKPSTALKPDIDVPVNINRGFDFTQIPSKAPTHFLSNTLPDCAGQNRPPDETFAKKNAVALFEAVAGSPEKPGLWDQVRFVDNKGRKIRHFANIKTDKGEIRLELLSDAAPNHVRSFVALARAGYFDGLPFHKSTREEGPLRGYLESGCPKGTGEFGYGSIGYWLKPEIKDDLVHADGTVGAWSSKDANGADLANAACKFYVSLGQSVGLDGNYTIFGKIVQGLDVAHTINRTQVKEDDILAGAKNLILIRQVAIDEVVDANLVASK